MSACKNPGNSCKSRPKGYTVAAEICNTSDQTINVYDVEFEASGTALALTYSDGVFAVPARKCEIYYLNAQSGNSANQAFTLETTIYWSHTPDPADDDMQQTHLPVSDTLLVPATPPGCLCPETGARVTADQPDATQASEPVAEQKTVSEEAVVEGKSTKETVAEEPKVEVKETVQPITPDAEAAADTAPTPETAGEETANG